MKKTGIIMLLTLLAGCKPVKPQNGNVSLTSDCPEDGHCKIALSHGKTLSTKAGENNENFHYELVADTDKSTVIFEYSRNVPKGIMDADYRETIAVAIDNNVKSGTFTDFDAVFGRFCYCKGATGYYKIKKGKLTVTTNNQETDYSLEFKTDEVPQVIQHIDFTIK